VKTGFYCKQQNGIHCGKGMVFSINAATSGDKTMAAFKQLAVNKNGTGLLPGALQSVDPAASNDGNGSSDGLCGRCWCRCLGYGCGRRCAGYCDCCCGCWAGWSGSGVQL
jgi:hypothetical protein